MTYTKLQSKSESNFYYYLVNCQANGHVEALFMREMEIAQPD